MKLDESELRSITLAFSKNSISGVIRLILKADTAIHQQKANKGPILNV
jgi:hypothetical protein